MSSAKRRNSKAKGKRKLGVWILGARGGLATTMLSGARAIARGMAPSTGLLTESPMFEGFGLPELGDLVFGGHDIRRSSTREAALEIYHDSGAINRELIDALKPDFKEFDHEVRLGAAPNAGKAILAIADEKVRLDERSLREITDSFQKEISSFKKRKGLDRVVVVNLMSTEAPLRSGPAQRSRKGLEKALDQDKKRQIRPSQLYAYAAAMAGCPFIHFTPSNATLSDSVQECFEDQGLPYMGCDGKTGETLVKSALAPMFKYRNLRVRSWLGYNLLGDRDGAILNNPDNKSSKVQTKDSLLPGILGYPLHTHVGIDYVPSLGDMKTAWDYIHFEGFLGFRMSMQFTWQGCDSVLAAPLVLDMLRLADHAATRCETGPMKHLACFFKRPIGILEDDLHMQWHMLERYAKQKREPI